ncbi:MAG: tyrosine-type recombinase/integrase [Cyanobacteria bacterium]|jgi:integrase/recombinase XerC|nr:tyrosine-type recombinase/integrase [Cyanobacteria bacterium GSL.Bin21]
MNDLVAASSFLISSHRDILAELLADKRSPNTRHAYEKDLRDFFRTLTGSEPTPELVQAFLQLERLEAVSVVLQYKAQLFERGLKQATVNRRLAAIKSLVNYAYQVGKCTYTLATIKGEKVQKYRDTTGVSAETFRRVLALPDRETSKGKRDYALLRILWENALRRGEVSKANLEDFDPQAKVLRIRGKGKGDQVEVIDLSLSMVKALLLWLKEGRELTGKKPLFWALDRAHRGHRLTGSAIAQIVQGYCRQAGIEKPMSPHRIRHSSITAALDVTDGNVRKVQKLSRHSNLDTLMIYDDNRTKDQLEISDLLADLV